MEKLKEKILEKLKERTKESILLEMGYAPEEVHKAVLRLDRLLSDSLDDWLMELDCDQKFFGEEFLVNLCEVLDIEDAYWIEALNECRPLGTIDEEGLLPTLYAVTDFKNSGEFSPGKSEFENFHIELQEYFEALEGNVGMEHIIEIVKTHYDCHGGTLRGWGNILYYSYRYNDEKDMCLIYPDGRVKKCVV